MKSMTGFGRASGEVCGRRVAVTVQTVNHRTLDLVIRLPEPLRGCEAEVRERLTGRISRGRCEVIVVVSEEATEARRRLDPEAVRGWLEAARPLIDAGLVEPRLTLGDLLRAGSALATTADGEDAPVELPAILDLVGEAAKQAAGAREFEGERLARVVADRLAELDRGVDELEARRGEAVARAAAALKSRVEELAGQAGVSEERLAQEVAILVEKGDIAEELDRLRSHIAQFQLVMDADGLIGKRLDFLTQEISRELNTVSAKARDSEMLQRALDAKVVCEQLQRAGAECRVTRNQGIAASSSSSPPPRAAARRH